MNGNIIPIDTSSTRVKPQPQPASYTPWTVLPRVKPQVIKDPHDRPGQFASALAHEVRNPLTNINLSVEMLLAGIKDEEQRIYLDIILRSSIRVNNIITGFLKQQQAAEAPVERHSLHQLLEESLELVGDRITLKNITVVKDYMEEDGCLTLNRPEMKMALTNIIVNAIEAMTIGKGKLILVTTTVGSKCIVRIEDNGCGISKEHLKYIFQPYFTNKPGGLGLGLATTYETLRSNGVAVNVESEEGRGTSFTLCFSNLI